MPWKAAVPSPSARRRRRGGLIYPPAAGPSSMGLPPQILLIFRFELDGERRRRPGSCFPSPIEFLLLAARFPTLRSCVGRVDLEDDELELDWWAVLEEARRGRPGTGDGERRTQEESRPRLVVRPQVLNRLVSPVRLVGRLRKTIA